MLSFIVYQLLRIIILSFAVLTIIYFLFQAGPGDQATLLAGASATQSEIDTIRRQLGLDRPIHQR